MSVPSGQGGPRTWSIGLRFTVLSLLVLFALGVSTDLLAGLPLSRWSRSWTAWLVGIVTFGGLCLVGEMGSEWIAARDKVDDPPWKRIWRLAQLLGLVALVCFLLAGVVRMVMPHR